MVIIRKEDMGPLLFVIGMILGLNLSDRTYTATQVEKEFTGYRKRFFELVQEECPTYTNDALSEVMIFDRGLEMGTVGECTRTSNHIFISIDPVYWNAGSTYEQAVLVYHEMTHCYLYQDHLTEDPLHYMAPSTDSIRTLQARPVTELEAQVRERIQSYCGDKQQEKASYSCHEESP